MRRSVISGAMAIRVSMPWLRRSSPQCDQDSTVVLVHGLPSSNLVDQRNAIRTNQVAAIGVVSGDPSADAGQNGVVGLGVETANRRVLQHRLESQTQDYAGDERAG